MRLTRRLKPKNSVSVKRMVHERLAGMVKARGYKRTHASDTTKPDFCPREVALLDTMGLTPDDEFIGTALNITFRHGEDNNYLFTDVWMRDAVVGDWKCGACSNILKFSKYKKTCPDCGCADMTYQEVRFESLKSGVSCGVDAFIDVGASLLLPIELKTIDKDKFKDSKTKKELAAPLAEHKQRTCIYLRTIEESNHPHKHKINTQEAVILYRSKGHGIKDEAIRDYPFRDDLFSPFKEFFVKRDDSLTSTPIRKAWAVKQFRDNGEYPEGICNTSFCPKAMACKVSKECFSGKYKITTLWKESRE